MVTFFFVIWVLRPVTIISLILSRVNHKVGGKRDIPEKKNTRPPATWTWLILVTQAKFEPTSI